MVLKVPEILTEPPENVVNDLNELKNKLDNEIPQKKLDDNLLIATWNIKSFGKVTRKWIAGQNDSPVRDLHALRCITDIISRFDVVSIQEVRGNIQALRDMMKALGPDWNFVLTDTIRSHDGNWERLAYIFDTRRVKMSGLACELVLTQEELSTIAEGTLRKQFARTPYAVSFKTGGSPLAKPTTFILVTTHIDYGRDAEERKPEVAGFAEWLADWARYVNSYGQNMIALGDFNIDRRGDELYDAFVKHGLEIPEVLVNVPRSIFDDPSDPLDKYYDQIAWFTGSNDIPALTMRCVDGGIFDFTAAGLNSRGFSKQKLQHRMSDHYLLWVEFNLNPNIG